MCPYIQWFWSSICINLARLRVKLHVQTSACYILVLYVSVSIKNCCKVLWVHLRDVVACQSAIVGDYKQLHNTVDKTDLLANKMYITN